MVWKKLNRIRSSIDSHQIVKLDDEEFDPDTESWDHLDSEEVANPKYDCHRKHIQDDLPTNVADSFEMEELAKPRVTLKENREWRTTNLVISKGDDRKCGDYDQNSGRTKFEYGQDFDKLMWERRISSLIPVDAI